MPWNFFICRDGADELLFNFSCNFILRSYRKQPADN